MNRNRSGFTLVELMVAIVIGGLIIAALHQVLQLQSQSVQMQTAQISVQQSNRITLGVLAGEIREVDAAEGDLLMASTDSLRVRVVRKLGFACAVDSLLLQLNVWEAGTPFETDDSIVVFVDNDTISSIDDGWRTVSVTDADTLTSLTTSCGATEFNGETASTRRLTVVDTGSVAGIRRGAIVRSVHHLTYGLFNIDGEWMVGRREADGTLTPLIGPLESGGLSFTYRDTLGAVLTPTTAAQRAAVRRIGITVRGVNDGNANTYTDSLVTQVFLRNE